MSARAEPVIAEPEIHGGIELDESCRYLAIIILAYTWTYYKTNAETAKELNTCINPVLGKLQEYRRICLQHKNRMPHSRLLRIVKNYRPTGRRNQGRLLKRLLDVRPEWVNMWPNSVLARWWQRILASLTIHNSEYLVGGVHVVQMTCPLICMHPVRQLAHTVIIKKQILCFAFIFVTSILVYIT